MLPACVDASAGNHGTISASGIPIAVPITPSDHLQHRALTHRSPFQHSNAPLQFTRRRHPMGSVRRTAAAGSRGSPLAPGRDPSALAPECSDSAPSTALASTTMIAAIVASDPGESHASAREGCPRSFSPSGPGHTLREAAAADGRRHVGAAVVLDPDGPGPGRDHRARHPALRRRRRGPRPGARRRASDLAAHVRLARLVARARRGGDGPRRLPPPVVVEGGELVGILSMRDIVRCWTGGRRDQRGARAAEA